MTTTTDFLVIAQFEGDDEPSITLTFSDFLAENEFDEQDVAAMTQAFDAGEAYYDGGGAAAAWSVKRAPS